MVNPKPAWISMLPGRLPLSRYSLEELRSAKAAHAFLTEEVNGPEGFGECLRSFRFLLFFGIACVAEDKYPPLTRCWKDLEQLFMHDPAFEDGVFIQSWILTDFPFGPKGETALDYFEQFLDGIDDAPKFQPFIDAARRSRLGLHQDVMRTKKVAKFRELISGKVTEAFPSIEEYGKGEILLTRMLAYKGQVFCWGDPKGFPREKKKQIEDMVQDKMMVYADPQDPPEVQYEKFMKLAGPYWMSCVTQNEAVPILAPDHYLTYLGRQESVPKMSPPPPISIASGAHAAAPAGPGKVGRNEPCPCGSGKKYKRCCGNN
jgi:hypothetical protein